MKSIKQPNPEIEAIYQRIGEILKTDSSLQVRTANYIEKLKEEDDKKNQKGGVDFRWQRSNNRVTRRFIGK